MIKSIHNTYMWKGAHTQNIKKGFYKPIEKKCKQNLQKMGKLNFTKEDIWKLTSTWTQA